MTKKHKVDSMTFDELTEFYSNGRTGRVVNRLVTEIHRLNHEVKRLKGEVAKKPVPRKSLVEQLIDQVSREVIQYPKESDEQ